MRTTAARSVRGITRQLLVKPTDSQTMQTPTPTTLEGHGVRLEPLQPDHAVALARAAADGELWKLWYTSVPEPENTVKYIDDALAGQTAGHMLAWVVRDLPTNEIVGSTRYHDIVTAIDRVEIGY